MVDYIFGIISMRMVHFCSKSDFEMSYVLLHLNVIDDIGNTIGVPYTEGDGLQMCHDDVIKWQYLPLHWRPLWVESTSRRWTPFTMLINSELWRF